MTSKTETVSDNAMIAEFMPDMEWVIPNNPKYRPYWRNKNTLAEYNKPEKLLYNKSWDWLMPVVEKIVKYCDDIIALSTEWHSVYVRPLNLALMRANIQDAYKAVVEFIKWHNSQPHK